MTATLIDSHVHLWNPERFPLPWLAGDTLLERPFELPDFEATTSSNGVTGFVYVETAVAPEYALLEARWITQLAETHPLIKGVVAHAPLEYGARIRPYLNALAALSPTVKGVRRNLQDETDAEFCLKEDFLEGIRTLPEYGFSFDICIKHPQLRAVTEMVRRCPETTFILDHLGKPDARAGALEPWRADIRALAALPNVACKLSGLVTEADPESWSPESLEPYVTHVLECFGERTMFGSDWPVLLSANSYEHWLETVETLTRHLDEADKTALYSGAATHWYCLDPEKGRHA